jgi:ribosome-binding factor A
MTNRRPDPGAPSQRQLRVAEEVRHALAGVFTRGEFRDPALADTHITVTEVRASPDLKHMTVFVSNLGRDVTPEQFAALKRAHAFIRGEVVRAVRLRMAPELHFHTDTALDYAMKMNEVLNRPEVTRDTKG